MVAAFDGAIASCLADPAALEGGGGGGGGTFFGVWTEVLEEGDWVSEMILRRSDFAAGGTSGTIGWKFVKDCDPETPDSQAGAMGAEKVEGREDGEEVMITVMAAAKIRLDSLDMASKDPKDAVHEDDQASNQAYSGGDKKCDDRDDGDDCDGSDGNDGSDDSGGGGVYDAINTGKRNIYIVSLQF